MPLGCAIAILYLLDSDDNLSSKSFVLAIVLAIVAVLTRQLYLWVVPILVLYALSNKQWTTTRKLIAAGAATLPLLAVLPLFLLWNGFTNSSFTPQHELHDGILNGKALVLALCTLGLFAAVFGPSMTQVLMPDARGRVLLLVTFALAMAVLPALGANAGSYRVPMEGGWLRAVAEHTPVVFHIWSLFWILFPLGCVVIAAMSYHAMTTRREVWILVALVLWLLLNVMQARAMAKYYEPFEMVVVSRFAVRARSRWWVNIPVWALAAVFVVVDIFRFWFGSGWASPGFG
jgi:ABC-type multidrug transport system fused ATPase/permease subunit